MAQRVGEFAKAAGDRLDVMINNAGILRTGRFEDIDIAAQLKEIDINTKGVVNGLHAAFPYLRATPKSVVVNLASASAIYGQAELATYSATKFFVRGITEALDIEWSGYGIRVIAMWPLYVKTAMTENIKTGTTESLGINLTAQDVADAIVAAVEPVLAASGHPSGALPGRHTDQGGGRVTVLARVADSAGQQATGALLSSPARQPSATGSAAWPISTSRCWTCPRAPPEDPEAYLRAAIAWHFGEDTGRRFWLRTAQTLNFDPLTDVKTFADLRLFPNLLNELRNVPIEDLIPRGYGSPPPVPQIFESGGTTGAPKRTVQLPDWVAAGHPMADRGLRHRRLPARARASCA